MFHIHLVLKYIYCIFLFFPLGHSTTIGPIEAIRTEYAEAIQTSAGSSIYELHAAENERHLPREETNAESEAAPRYNYASVHGLKSLVKLEFTIYEKLRFIYGEESNYSDSDSSRNLLNYLRDYEETSGKLLEDFELTSVRKVERVSWNILASYRMIRRFRLYIINWLHFLPEDKLFQKVLSFLKSVYDPAEGPTEVDFQNVMVALANIHFINDLTANDISEGKLMGEDMGITLDSTQCFEIGNTAIKTGFFSVGIQWLELALEKSCSDPTINRREIEEALRFTLIDPEYQKSINSETTKDHPLLSEGNITKEYFVEFEAIERGKEQTFSMSNHFGICSGKSHMSEMARAELFCWFEYKIHPFWRIGPIKAEFLSFYPAEVVQYHQVFSHKIVESLRELASELSPSKTVSDEDQTTDLEDVTARLSATKWVPEDSAEETKHVSQIIGAITGLKVKGNAAEELQITAYTPGGHYSIHLDTLSTYYSSHPAGTQTSHPVIIEFLYFLSNLLHIPLNYLHWPKTVFATLFIMSVIIVLKKITKWGLDNLSGDSLIRQCIVIISVKPIGFDENAPVNRLATFMIYLSDVAKGGETSFVQCGMRARPEKGSAVFWYNMLPSGEANEWTWHGACPVVFGEKWVANKWIGYAPQDHIECHLDPQSKFSILVNSHEPQPQSTWNSNI